MDLSKSFGNADLHQTDMKVTAGQALMIQSVQYLEVQ